MKGYLIIIISKEENNMRSITYYATNEEFMQVLAKGGYVPVKYKDCNCHGATEYFINEDCNLIHVLPTRIRAKKEPDVAYTKYTYNPEKSRNNSGYHLIYIGFSALLHRVMAYTFLGNPAFSQTDVDHIDENKDNCSPSNLRWCTHSENQKKHCDMKKEV